MADDNEKQTQERAYLLWQKEGCPDGRDKEFWERGRLLHEADAAPSMVTPLQARSAEEAAVDEAVAETFPASDPPAFAATVGVGSSSEQSVSRPQE